MRGQRGFTIVELLIIIVVIAILAAISVVAYMGIQNRANDSSVQSDLRQTSQKLEVYRQTDPSTQYPRQVADLQTLELNINTSAYEHDVQRNFIYCLSEDRQAYALVAMSKSGQRYIVSNVVSDGEYDDGITWTATNVNVTTLCPSIDSSLVHRVWGLSEAGGTWNSWVGA